MSTTAIQVITDAAIAFGDPGYSRVTESEWLLWLNRVSRATCSRINILERVAYFDLVAGNDLYGWPEDSVTITALAATSTPDNIYSYTYLHEMVKEEFRAATSAYYPDGVTTHYYPSRQYFNLYPRPQDEVSGGGMIEYYGLPANLDLSGDVLEIPDFFRDYLSAGMTVLAHRKAKELEEAQTAERYWVASEQELIAKLEDRTDDRRKSLRPSNAGRRGGQW